jgi:hypothetical protein
MHDDEIVMESGVMAAKTSRVMQGDGARTLPNLNKKDDFRTDNVA